MFAAWYAAAPWLSRGVAATAATIAESVAPIRSAVPSHGDAGITFVVKPAAATVMERRLPPDIAAEIPIDTLKYSYGLPFFVALMLASRPRGAAWKLAAGSAVVLASAALGVAADLVIQAATASAPNGAPLVPLGGATRESVAVAYQLGVLIFPTVVPIVLWGAFSREAFAAPT